MDKFFSSTPSVLNKLQILTIILSIIGFFFVEFTIANIFIFVFFFYLYSIVGLSMMMHRYYSHKSFKLNKFFEIILTFVAILAGRGSTIGWVYIHRLHHAFSDTEKDPHSPKTIGFKLFGFKPLEEKKPNVFLVKELLTPFHLFINKWYILLLLGWIIFLVIISPTFLYFSWILPVLAIQISQNSLNYFAHTKGYRNFETRDDSTNNFYLWPFVFGDAWHNNHHADPLSITTKINKFEFDPVSVLIKVLRKNA